MNKKIIVAFAALCLSTAGMAQSAVTSGKAPAQEPAKSETAVQAAPATEAGQTVSTDKKATTAPAAPANEAQQDQPATGTNKITGQQKKPE